MPKAKKTHTAEELSLLLYLEDRAVNHAGRLNGEHLNDADRETLGRWNDDRYVRTGRIVKGDVTNDGASWAWLSPGALRAAHAERKVRMRRNWEWSGYKTTLEKRGEPLPVYK